MIAWDSPNLLTTQLLREGYDQLHHPPHVRWVGHMGYPGEFQYTFEFLLSSFWRTGCGLYCKLKDADGGGTGWNGMFYSPENDNHLIPCATPEKEADCPHAIRFPYGYECPVSLSESYNYENSAERIEKEKDKIQRESLDELVRRHPGAWSCACRTFDRVTHRACFNYNPANCLSYGGHGCLEERCCITGKSRDTSLANIYYDRRITIVKRKGFLTWTDTNLLKGIRRFSTQKPVDALEAWLHAYPDGVLRREQSEYHHVLYRYGGAMKLAVENIRIEKRSTRDILQDIKDTEDGIFVAHDTERLKKLRAHKRDLRQKRTIDEQRREDSRGVKVLLAVLERQDTPRDEREDALRRLQELGVDVEHAVRKEQLSLF